MPILDSCLNSRNRQDSKFCMEDMHLIFGHEAPMHFERKITWCPDYNLSQSVV
jgi:hypothetical protein